MGVNATLDYARLSRIFGSNALNLSYLDGLSVAADNQRRSHAKRSFLKMGTRQTPGVFVSEVERELKRNRQNREGTALRPRTSSDEVHCF
jgi:hypothetical protein